MNLEIDEEHACPVRGFLLNRTSKPNENKISKLASKPTNITNTK